MSAVLNRRVLLAEDDPQQLAALGRILEQAGFEVVPAHDGVEALELARTRAVDSAVIDLLLRRLDGLRVCELLKRDPTTTNLPVLILSGLYLDGDDARRALAAGADCYLPKPEAVEGSGSEVTELVRQLEHVLGLPAGQSAQRVPVTTVLIIDDDPENRAFLRKALRGQGARVLEAATSEEGLRQLAQEAPGLVLLDVRMPGESGLDLLPRIRALHPETVVAMMTAFGSEEVAAEAVRRGADDYIAKPIDLRRLRELVERNLEKHRLRLDRQDLLRRLKESNRYLTRQHQQLRLAEEHILAVNRQLEQANRFKSEFLANMSHELRTPLNAIIGFSEILLDPTMQDVNENEHEEFVRNIHTSGKHLLQLINEILDLAKVEAGKMELHRAELDIPASLAEVVAIIDPLARQGNLRLVVEQDAELPHLAADRSKFKQVLYNLLSNAVKFTPAGGQVTLAARRVDEDVRFAVHDTGIGIHPQEYPKLFREFQQLDPSYTRKYEGTGLGLALSKRFVEMHGGRIWAESQPGQGSTFYFTMPIRVPLAGQVAELTVLEGGGVPAGDQPLVLVVDDDRRAAELAGRMLRQAGYRVSYARDGDEALLKAVAQDPQIVVLEVVLPGKDGWAVLQELKSLPVTRDTPVIVASVMDNRALAFSLGAADYALKPIERDDFVPRIHRLARQVQAFRERVKVLLVHSDRDFIRETASLLVGEHFEVFRAEDHKDAARKLEATRSHVVVIEGEEQLAALAPQLGTARGFRPHVIGLGRGLVRPAPGVTWLSAAGITPAALVEEIQRLEVVQRTRRVGHDRRQSIDRRRQPREPQAGAVRPGA
jgi:signal transduction histidine kinase